MGDLNSLDGLAGVQDIWNVLGVSENDLSQVTKIQQAAELVKQGKLKPEVYDQLLAMVKKQFEEKKGGGKRSDNKKFFGGNKPEQIVVPQGKPIMEGYMFKKPKSSKAKITAKNWRRRYFALYKHCLIYYKYKDDTTPKGMLQLNADFYVSEVKGKNPNDREHTFVLSDLNHSFYLGAETEDVKKFWMHTFVTVLRKLQDDAAYFDTPLHMDKPRRSPEQIQQDYEQRLQAYRESKVKKPRKSLWGTLKKKNKEKEARKLEALDKEAQAKAIASGAQELEQEERSRAKEYEDNQVARERELQKAKADAKLWKSKAEEYSARAEEEFNRAEKEHEIAERTKRELQKQLDDYRAQARAREEALVAERDQVLGQLDGMKTRKSQHIGVLNGSQMEEFEKERKALMAKLDALQSALDVDLGSLDWDGTLEDAENKMKALLPMLSSEDPKVSQDALQEFDQWDKIIRNHAEYKQREKDKWVHWEKDNKPKNEAAANEMREMVPPSVISGITLEDLQKNKKVTPGAARRILKTQILKFLYMEKEEIAKIHVADLSSRYVPQGLDIRELRAIYSRLPDEFQNDRDGRKKTWLDQLRNKLMDFTTKEEKGQLMGSEKMNPAYLPPGSRPAGGGGRPGGAPGGPRGKPQTKMKLKGANGKPANKIDTSALQAALASKLSGGGPPIGGPNKKGPPSKFGGPPGAGAPAGLPFGKVPAAVLASRKAMEEASGGDTPAPIAMSPPAISAAAISAAAASRHEKPSSSHKQQSPKANKSPSNSSRRRNTKKPAAAEDGTSGFFAKAASYFAPQAEQPQAKATTPSSSSRDKRGGGKSSKDKSASSSSRDRRRKKDGGRRKKGGAKREVEEEDSDDSGDDVTDNEGQRQSEAKADAFGNRIEEGIQELCQLIRKNGAQDQAEGGIATMTFGDLYEMYEGVNDMLVGILMRAKKKKKLRYQGDMLFQGIHDKVKITLLS